MKKRQTSAFTIVELLIVIVVIGILATIVVVAFNGVQRSAAIAALQSELKQASTKLELAKIDASDGNYPSSLSDIGITDTDTVAFQYTRTTSPKAYCITATTTAQANTPPYHISSTDQEPTEGLCDGHTDPNADDTPSILYLQTVTKANCPTERTMAVDARDNHTYWIKRITNESPAYNECWMLTNLAYGGGTTNGGVSTYGDVKALADGTGSSVTYTVPRYYVNPTGGTLFTINPTVPSADTTGGGDGANRQYGYLYNWCGAMGAQNGTNGQPNTTACANHATLPALPNQSISICPAGWRLPTGAATTGELQLLANAIGATNDAQGSTSLRAAWLGQMGGDLRSGFDKQGSYGYFWSSTQYSTSYAYFLSFTESAVQVSATGKNYGFAVRCLAT